MFRTITFLSVGCLFLGLGLGMSGCDQDRSQSLVGTYRLTASDKTETYVFKPDLTFTFERVVAGSATTSYNGTFAAISDRLMLDFVDGNGERTVTETSYYVGPSGFAFGYLPQGRHQGPVGTWQGGESRTVYHADGTATVTPEVELRYALKADGSASGPVNVTPPLRDGAGTWTLNDQGKYVILLTAVAPPISGVALTEILYDNSILTQNPYDRLP